MSRRAVAAALQLVGAAVIAAGVGMLALWAGLVVLGAGLIVLGVATELNGYPRRQLAPSRDADDVAEASAVYAWTREPGKGGPPTGGNSPQLSLRDVAELGIRGFS